MNENKIPEDTERRIERRCEKSEFSDRLLPMRLADIDREYGELMKALKNRIDDRYYEI